MGAALTRGCLRFSYGLPAFMPRLQSDRHKLVVTSNPGVSQAGWTTDFLLVLASRRASRLPGPSVVAPDVVGIPVSPTDIPQGAM